MSEPKPSEGRPSQPKPYPPEAPVTYKPVLPIVKMHGWKGAQLKWDAMHGHGPRALKWGRVHGLGGTPFASAYVDFTAGKIILPEDWDETYSEIDREMLRLTLNSYKPMGFAVVEMSFNEYADYLAEIDAKKWLREWNRPDRAVFYGLGVEAFQAELKKEWHEKWSGVRPPAGGE